MVAGSCLCGAVRIAVDTPPEMVTECNCSACRKLGTLWAYYPPSQVRIDGETAIYMRGAKRLRFHHCAVCGCVTHWTAVDPLLDRMAVNARLMAPEIVAAARLHHFDGAKRD